MGKLIYLMTTSLDGYAADKDGNFGWAMPTEEVHTFVNDTLRGVGTVLMGRNLYETMKIWDEIPTEGTSGPMDGPSQAMNDYAKIWRDANKIVYSTTMTEVAIANTTIEQKFDSDRTTTSRFGSMNARTSETTPRGLRLQLRLVSARVARY
jgi:dihydrofolate reductase